MRKEKRPVQIVKPVPLLIARENTEKDSLLTSLLALRQAKMAKRGFSLCSPWTAGRGKGLLLALDSLFFSWFFSHRLFLCDLCVL